MSTTLSSAEDSLKNSKPLKGAPKFTKTKFIAPAWVVSLLVHFVLLLAASFFGYEISKHVYQTTLLESHVPQEELELPSEFQFSEEFSDEIGAASAQGFDSSELEAPTVSLSAAIPTIDSIIPLENTELKVSEVVQPVAALHFDESIQVKGLAGEGVTDAKGAVDRVTHEILNSLEERPTLVVWFFDESGSLTQQREEIKNRFDQIYKELGVAEVAEHSGFKNKDEPLLTSIVSFGNHVKLQTPQPTQDLQEIKEAINALEVDDSGVENIFLALNSAVQEYKGYRRRDTRTKEPRRNVMFVLVTDEVGDDVHLLEDTVTQCNRYQIPVYVIGVPAPFGRAESYIKWVDPDPQYDQSPQWSIVNQGPETCLPERIRIQFSGTNEREAPIDSGFGPYALTRLAYETGGIYFTTHPNRKIGRHVSRRETDPFASHLQHFFDPEVMRRYRPDYLPQKEYLKRLSKNKARQALIQAASLSWIGQMETPRLRFVKRNEAFLAAQLTEAQKVAAVLEPRQQQVYNTLKLGEGARKKEENLRWQASYDLAMGRALAARVRTEQYNAMLAQAKRGISFQNPANNTWILVHSDQVTVNSRLKTMQESSKQYLERVLREHPGTPWAHLAALELKVPLGWQWTESYTNIDPPRINQGNGGTPPPGVDEQLRMQDRKPRRSPPKL
ncbi:MAG: VWA domain-containing protein [Pirellulaceae bacterium]|nr:VWA domain-containing protein [Pirellulaceae bacterium]